MSEMKSLKEELDCFQTYDLTEEMYLQDFTMF